MRKVTAGLFCSLDGVVQAPSEWQPAFDEAQTRPAAAGGGGPFGIGVRGSRA